MYRPSSNFTERSNRWKDKKVCENHLTSIWGKDQFGNYYTRCTAGHRLNEDCRELIEKEVNNNE